MEEKRNGMLRRFAKFLSDRTSATLESYLAALDWFAREGASIDKFLEAEKSERWREWADTILRDIGKNPDGATDLHVKTTLGQAAHDSKRYRERAEELQRQLDDLAAENECRVRWLGAWIAWGDAMIKRIGWNKPLELPGCDKMRAMLARYITDSKDARAEIDQARRGYVRASRWLTIWRKWARELASELELFPDLDSARVQSMVASRLRYLVRQRLLQRHKLYEPEAPKVEAPKVEEPARCPICGAAPTVEDIDDRTCKARVFCASESPAYISVRGSSRAEAIRLWNAWALSERNADALQGKASKVGAPAPTPAEGIEACPHCQGVATYTDIVDGAWRASLYCQGCQLTALGVSKADVVANWNACARDYRKAHP